MSSRGSPETYGSRRGNCDRTCPEGLLRSIFAALALAGAASLAEGQTPQPRVPEEVVLQPPSCLTAEEAHLARLINEYRAENGLAPVPLSTSLTEVAKSHVFDLAANLPSRQTDPNGKPCSLHSWSKGGPWNSVCYTRDHAFADAMWGKPREVTCDVYDGRGFENAYWSSRQVTPELALQAWKKSPAHNALILQQGGWREEPWSAMGVALSDHFAVVWFGDEPDPLGECTHCGEARQAPRSPPPEAVSSGERPPPPAFAPMRPN